MLQTIQNRIDWISAKIAFIIWLILNILHVEEIHFESTYGMKYSVCKILHFVYLYFVVYILRKIWVNRKMTEYKQWIFFTGLYYLITMIIFSFLWPGTWSWDDAALVYQTRYWILVPWQHFLSSLIQIIFLETLPFAAGVILQQLFIAGLIVGWVISRVFKHFQFGKFQKLFCAVLLFLPAISPPVLMYIYSGFRMGLYSYLELFLIFFLIEKRWTNSRFSWSDISLAIFLIALVASWRSEAMYYPILIGITLLFLNRKVITLKKISIIAVASLLLTLAMGKCNNYLLGNNTYSVVSTLKPLVDIIRVADKEECEAELQAIDKVIDTNYVFENGESGIGLYWTGNLMKDYTDDDYREYLKAYLSLLLKYPKTAIESMYEIFVSSTGVALDENGHSRQSMNTMGALTIFDSSAAPGTWWAGMKSPFKHSIVDEELRANVIRLLGCVDSENRVKPFYFIFYNLWIPFTLISISFLYDLIHKKWFETMLIITVTARIAIVFISAVSPYLMYYLDIYLVGYMLAGSTLIEVIGKKQKRCTDADQFKG